MNTISLEQFTAQSMDEGFDEIIVTFTGQVNQDLIWTHPLPAKVKASVPKERTT